MTALQSRREILHLYISQEGRSPETLAHMIRDKKLRFRVRKQKTTSLYDMNTVGFDIFLHQKNISNKNVANKDDKKPTIKLMITDSFLTCLIISPLFFIEFLLLLLELETSPLAIIEPLILFPFIILLLFVII